MKKKILLLRLDAIGDFVLFTSVLPELRKLYKDYYITLAVNPTVYPMARNCPYVDTIIEIDQIKYATDIKYVADVAKQLKGKFDIVINTMYTRTWQSDNIIARTHAPIKIGFQCVDKDSERNRRLEEEILYTHLVPTETEWMFELDRYKNLLNEIGAPITGRSLKPELWISTEDRKWANDFIKTNFNSSNKFAILCPGAGFDTKLWLSKSFAKVADYIIEKIQMSVVIAGSEKDKKLASEIMTNTKNRTYDLTGKITLNQFTALVENSSMYCGIDTAGFHIAWTLGIPTIGIFGGGHFGRFTPTLPPVIIVYHKMDCYNCYWNCIYNEAKCITSINANNVIDKIEHLLRTTKTEKK